MINNPEQTTQEEILLISQTFGIPIDKIQAVLLKNDNPPKKTKDPKKAIPKKIDNSESLTPQMEILNFNDFDDFYINAKNREEEITVIRKLKQ